MWKHAYVYFLKSLARETIPLAHTHRSQSAAQAGRVRRRHSRAVPQDSRTSLSRETNPQRVRRMFHPLLFVHSSFCPVRRSAIYSCLSLFFAYFYSSEISNGDASWFSMFSCNCVCFYGVAYSRHSSDELPTHSLSFADRCRGRDGQAAPVSAHCDDRQRVRLLPGRTRLGL